MAFPKTSALVELLLQACRNDNSELINTYLRSISDLKENCETVVRGAIEAIRSEEALTQYRADQGLEKLKSDAIPILMVMLKDRDVRIRRKSIYLLTLIGLPDAALGLSSALYDTDYEIISQAISEFFSSFLNGCEFSHTINIDVCTNIIDRIMYFVSWDIDQDRTKLESMFESRYSGIPNSVMMGSAILGNFGHFATRAIPTLITLIEKSRDEGAKYYSIKALGDIGSNSSLTFLINLLTDSTPFLGVLTESINKIRTASKENSSIGSSMGGLEVMGDAALQMEDVLDTFRRIGTICSERKTDSFTFTEMETMLGSPKSTIQNHMDKVSNLFRLYFRRYEGIVILPDKDLMASTQNKLFKRQNGAPAAICRPLGWRAWELTCQYLGHREKIDIARRNTNKNFD